MVNAADVAKRFEQMKKDGRKTALVLIFSPTENDTRFVPLKLE